MVGQQNLALALLGLGAVHALPAQQPTQQVEERAPQIFGPPTSSFGPGDLPRPENVPCNPITEKWCWWPVTAAPPTTNEGDHFGFGTYPRRDNEEAVDKAKRSSVDDLKHELIDLETRLQILQNRPDKSHDDWDEIRWLRRELDRLAGIVRIIAPPGTITTFTPGKRDEGAAKEKRQGLIFPGSGAKGNTDPASCPSLNEAARFLDKLLGFIDRKHLDRWGQDVTIQAFEAFLDGCNMGLEEVEDDEGVLIEVFRKTDREHSGGRRLWPRAAPAAPDAEPLDVTGLQTAHDAMLEALGDATPSIGTWMVLKQLEAELAAHGAPAAGAVAKRQGSGGIISIGEGACQLTDILALKAALAALGITYGTDRNRVPPSIFLIEQVIVTALQICRQDVPGWTTFTPGNPQPGGALVPERPAPGGGSVVPERPAPGGALVPERPAPGGGSVVPERPAPGGGRIVPERPGDGGRINPERPGDGGRINPERPGDGGRIIIPDRPGEGSPVRPSD